MSNQYAPFYSPYVSPPAAADTRVRCCYSQCRKPIDFGDPVFEDTDGVNVPSKQTGEPFTELNPHGSGTKRFHSRKCQILWLLEEDETQLEREENDAQEAVDQYVEENLEYYMPEVYCAGCETKLNGE